MPSQPRQTRSLMSLKIEPKTKGDEARLLEAVAELVRDDELLSFEIDPESRENILGGQSELHLDEVIGKLRALDIALNVGAPQVAYLETLERAATVEHTLQTRLSGDARVMLRLEPNAEGAGNEINCKVPEGNLLGKPIRLLPFQIRFIKEVYDNPAGTTRAYLSIARKNGKTGTIACLLLAHIVGPEAYHNSRIISGARTRKQAAEVFNYAAKMIWQSPELSKLARVVPSGKKIIGLARNVEYEAISAEAAGADLAVLSLSVPRPFPSFAAASSSLAPTTGFRASTSSVGTTCRGRNCVTSVTATVAGAGAAGAGGVAGVGVAAVSASGGVASVTG